MDIEMAWISRRTHEEDRFSCHLKFTERRSKVLLSRLPGMGTVRQCGLQIFLKRGGTRFLFTNLVSKKELGDIQVSQIIRE